MKTSSFFGILFTICLATFFSCSNPCKDVQCFNGGFCDNGECQCPPGYSGSKCEVFDPCYKTVCQNGGTCVNGKCQCPPNYSGENCQTYRTPRSMVIQKIVVNSYPHARQNGQGWDAIYPGTAGAAPEMYAKIVLNGTTIATSNYVNNAPYDRPITLSFSALPVVTNLSGRCEVVLYDLDSNTSELIGGYYFIPREYTTKPPTVIPMYNPDTWHKVRMDLHISWNY